MKPVALPATNDRPLMYSGFSQYSWASSARTTIAAAEPSATPEQSKMPSWPAISGALLHALFNNAGILDSVSPSKMRGEVWDWVIDVNLNGVYNCIQAFLPRMIERREGGLIVNVASLAGLVGRAVGSPITPPSSASSA